MIELTQEQIIHDWGFYNSDKPLVSVRCITYNHESYIAQALDGFLMQKTNFPFEIVVHDDASTDRTADIIREYEKKFPKIIKPIYETENQYSKGAGILGRIMNSACKGKYIAWCEGDDYWTDENKLQLQVDFLEKNLEYGLCYHKSKFLINGQIKNSFGRQRDGFYDLLINGNDIPTQSVVLRSSLCFNYQQEVKPSEHKWRMGDYPLWLYAALNTKIKFFDKEYSVYRVLLSSAGHGSNIQDIIAFEKNYYDIRNFFSKLSGVEIEEYDETNLVCNYFETVLLQKYSKNNARMFKKYLKNVWKTKRKEVTTKEYLKILICTNFIIHCFYDLYIKIKL